MYKTGVPNDVGFHQQTKIEPAKWPFLERVLKQYNKKISVLDIGCSAGNKLLYLYKKGYRKIYGIDYAARVFQHIWKQLPYLHINQGNAENLRRFRNQQFEIVYACHLLEHLPHPEKCVKEVARILKKNGTFVLGIPNGYHLSDIIMRIVQKIVYGRTDHLQTFDLKKITELLRSYSLRVTKADIDKGSLEFLHDVRLNRKTMKIPEQFLYPLVKKIYWKDLYFNIVAKK
ncbi:hypothetical protein A2866_04055 [Candidatus Roizmanbacteria bacterium RIFCSPHIGHO2_01_FULL_39_8]|uniref:Methyltransferase type 11 domain-containing protein n=2 Tax=Candidatus Roizmaniibacteriota TaxID=1752723 RepID=A0A1F7GPP1_9BACT|nr:MAG: hypothetical protein A2866_04055 [Candidatus Roizmanbacteria bacterium RIFCSPHIGHO2_01_FULL_39_8]OGK35167.1 MAG: hypothetical protein A3F60_02755 [Candidatus Roizmanbacteria bacterium RIFCSPHIGHO2_12_FULL_39_8]